MNEYITHNFDEVPLGLAKRIANSLDEENRKE